MRLFVAGLFALLSFSGAFAQMNPPIAAKRPHSFTHHGITVEDSYNWLKDPGYPTVDDADVLAYLNERDAVVKQLGERLGVIGKQLWLPS